MGSALEESGLESVFPCFCYMAFFSKRNKLKFFIRINENNQVNLILK